MQKDVRYARGGAMSLYTPEIVIKQFYHLRSKIRTGGASSKGASGHNLQASTYTLACASGCRASKQTMKESTRDVVPSQLHLALVPFAKISYHAPLAGTPTFKLVR